MTDRELDAEIAEFLGWRAWKEKRGQYELAVAVDKKSRKPWEKIQNGERESHRYTKITCREAQQLGFYGQGFPQFSTDVNAARLVLAEIEKRGQTAMMNLIYWYLQDRQRDKPDEHGIWAALTASPRQICEAALKAIE